MMTLVIKNDEDLEILKAIFRKDLYDTGIFATDLLRELGIQRQKFYKILDVYENHGLIDRKQCSFDARVKKIFITEKGKKTIDWITKINASIEKDMKNLGLAK